MRTLHAVWIPARDGDGEDIPAVQAHAEVWEYETPGPQYGRYVADLPDWTEEDCR